MEWLWGLLGGLSGRHTGGGRFWVSRGGACAHSLHAPRRQTRGLEVGWGGRAQPWSRPTPAPRCSPQLLQQCRLVERILTSWEENDRVQ